MKEEDDAELAYTGPFPAVVKPTQMENSVGVELVRNTGEMRAAIQGAWKSVPLPDQKGTPRKKSLRDRLSALFGGA